MNRMRNPVVFSPAALSFAVVLLSAVFLAGCSGRGVGGSAGRRVGETPPEERLARIVRDTGKVERIEGTGKARIENRLGEIEIEFTMVYEPGVVLELKGELAPGFLPFHGEVEITSTPDTTLAYVNGVRLVPAGAAFPGRAVHPALIAITLGGDYVLAWLDAQGCEVDEKLACGDITFEFDLNEETGRVKAWTLKHEDPDGSYDGYLYRSRRQASLELPEILTGMAYPFQVAVYVEYHQIDATIRQ